MATLDRPKNYSFFIKPATFVQAPAQSKHVAQVVGISNDAHVFPICQS